MEGKNERMKEGRNKVSSDRVDTHRNSVRELTGKELHVEGSGLSLAHPSTSSPLPSPFLGPLQDSPPSCSCGHHHYSPVAHLHGGGEGKEWLTALWGRRDEVERGNGGCEGKRCVERMV